MNRASKSSWTPYTCMDNMISRPDKQKKGARFTMNAVMSLLKEFPNLISLHGKTHVEPESYAFDGLEGGLPKGALVEISGAHGGGKTEVVLRFLAQNPGARVAW